MDIRRQLFDIFNSQKNKYDLYEEIKNYIEEVIESVRGYENANFYEVLCKLSNSINNAGCEERRSEQIDLLNKKLNEIANKYEKYLP